MLGQKWTDEGLPSSVYNFGQSSTAQGVALGFSTSLFALNSVFNFFKVRKEMFNPIKRRTMKMTKLS